MPLLGWPSRIARSVSGPQLDRNLPRSVRRRHDDRRAGPAASALPEQDEGPCTTIGRREPVDEIAEVLGRHSSPPFPGSGMGDILFRAATPLGRRGLRFRSGLRGHSRPPSAGAASGVRTIRRAFLGTIGSALARPSSGTGSSRSIGTSVPWPADRKHSAEGPSNRPHPPARRRHPVPRPRADALFPDTLYAGLEDQIDNHWGSILRAAGLSTLLAVGAELSLDEEDRLRSANRISMS